MDAIRFDALARSLAPAGSRRSLLAAASGAIAALWTRVPFGAEAGCKKVGAKCRRNGNCCAGARCRHGRCRCKMGWSNCSGKLCRNLASDAANCGACGTTCITGCCAGGTCRTPCGDDCCTECFGESGGPDPPHIPGTEFCCEAGSVCNRGTSDPTDDHCCWPDEACIDGECCCDGCEGTVVCGGKCCPSVSCCNGKCCGTGEVCARTQADKPRTCVSAVRSCVSDGDCFEDETCHGDICCSGDRVCVDKNQPSVEVCCSLGTYCEPFYNGCCANGIQCSTTGKKVRVRV
jgi:hypothetical protein